MDLLRLLVGFAGLLVGFFGIVFTSTEWMAGRPQFWGHWAVLIIGALMWLQSFPVMRAAEQQRKRVLLRKLLKGDKE